MVEWCRTRSTIAAVSRLSPANALSQLPKVRLEVRIIEPQVQLLAAIPWKQT